MTEKYTPKVGDKVRATLGENVLVGEVSAIHPTGGDVYINTDDLRWAFTVRPNDGWHFEQVVSVPSKFGAVIRRADGESFWLTTRSEKACPWLTQHGFWTDEKNATRGGFTVLFDGVDE